MPSTEENETSTEGVISVNSRRAQRPAPRPVEAPPRKHWLDAIRDRDLDAVKADVAAELRAIVDRHGLADYDVLFLYDNADEISAYHSDQLYKSAKRSAELEKDILLIIHSRGGRIEPAYVAGKTLKKLSKSKFSVAVPRKAKSAATLISLGADEINMGMISELGPIDPQIGDMPALALANALEVVADLAQKFPDSSGMLGKYISDQAPLRILGYFKRVNESAAQYAERLLAGKSVGEGMTIAKVADQLVNHYKDHSFVIDAEEARKLLGPMIKDNSPEYALADEIYEFLDLVRYICAKDDIDVWVVGHPEGFGWRLPRKDD